MEENIEALGNDMVKSTSSKNKNNAKFNKKYRLIGKNYLFEFIIQYFRIMIL